MRFLAPTVLGIAGAAILLLLGTWQVQRLAWKRGVLANIETMMAEAPAPVWERVDPVVAFAPVTMSGVAGSEELHVLVSHKKLGAGFRIVTGFETATGGTLLLDQGFVPAEQKDAVRQRLSGDVTGNLHIPDDRNGSTPENDVVGNIWFARDLVPMAAQLGAEPVLVILREADGLDPAITPMPVDTNAIPNDHLNYAITWFSLAAVWLGMTAFWLWRIKRRTA